MSMDDDEDEEPILLGDEALEALQSVLGVSLDRCSLNNLIASRRILHDDEEEDGEEIQEHKSPIDDSEFLRTGESHAEYYKRLFPERYMNSSGQATSTDKITHPVSLDNILNSHSINV